MTELTRVHRLHWIEDPPNSGNFAVVISDYAPVHAAQVTELLQLLALPVPRDPSQAVVLPVYPALNGNNQGSIAITSGSVMRLMESLSASVELAQKDQGNGTTIDYPATASCRQRAAHSLFRGQARPRDGCCSIS
ncbi:MAG: hypothetical protein WBM38_09980 [Arenicellales bacterium]|jgi:hypothetical protein